MYYKSGVAIALALARVVNYAPRVTLQIVASLTDDSKGIIYDCNMFIAQATGSGIDIALYRLRINLKNKFTTLGHGIIISRPISRS